MHDSPLFWSVFGVVILGMIAIDLGIFNKKAHVVSFKEALTWTGVWALLATAFGIWVWNEQGRQKGVEFFTGYLIELSLSADNVFIFALIFSSFAVPAAYQHKVLIWGVLSALVMRFIMISVGVALIERIEWLIYIFAAFLIVTGVKMLWKQDEVENPTDNIVVRWTRRVLPLTESWEDGKFSVVRDGKRYFTPLLVVLICIEVSDLIFAVDSIPAIFGITTDQFIIFTSNVFAIMGLRSLYFVLGGVIDKFHYLKTALGVILFFVGVKMCLGHTAYKIPTEWALGFTALALVVAVIASILFPKKLEVKDQETPARIDGESS